PEGIIYRKALIKNIYFPFEELKLVEVTENSSVFSFLLGTRYEINIFTLNHSLSLSSRYFTNGAKLQEIASLLSIFYDDSLIRFFTKRKRQPIFRKLITDPGGFVGFALMLVILFFYLWGAFSHIVFPPFNFSVPKAGILKNPTYQFAFDDRYRELAIDRPPDSEFWFGTDFVGRDIFSRLVYSTFYTITVVFIGALIPTVIGSSLGILSGFFGGPTDKVLQSLADSLMLIPPFALWMFAIALPRDLFKFDLFGNPQLHFEYTLPGAFYFQAFVILGGLYWAMPFRVVRQEVLSIKEEEFVQVQFVLGSSNFRILRKHIIPNLLPPIIIMLLTLFIEFIVVAVSISIAIGLEGDLIWGSDISRRLDPGYYKQTLEDYFLLWSTLWIGTTIFGLSLFTDALKDALDPTARTFEPENIKKIPPAELNDEERIILSKAVEMVLKGEKLVSLTDPLLMEVTEK
ncbi:MAG: ABC transporter permease, partial [Methanobacteriota archaeon]